MPCGVEGKGSTEHGNHLKSVREFVEFAQGSFIIKQGGLDPIIGKTRHKRRRPRPHITVKEDLYKRSSTDI